MTIQQLAGQMTQADLSAITDSGKETTNPQEAVDLALGSLLVSATAAPTDNGNLANIPSDYQGNI